MNSRLVDQLAHDSTDAESSPQEYAQSEAVFPSEKSDQPQYSPIRIYKQALVQPETKEHSVQDSQKESEVHNESDVKNDAPVGT